MKALFDFTDLTEWYVDELGKVYSKSMYYKGSEKRKIKEICPNINRKRGYLYARTTNKNWQIHRLVAKFFIPNPENKPYVNHKDGNKHNNKAENLEWVTAKENSQHAIKTGLFVTNKKNEGSIKYTNQQLLDVYYRIKRDGMSYSKAGMIHNMPYSTVAHLMRGSRRKIIFN